MCGRLDEELPVLDLGKPEETFTLLTENIAQIEIN
jgi:hypothetical protein